MELYLITGFLGAGKTTFLNEFIKQFKNKKLCVIVNEFGKTGVDGTLLKHATSDVSEISGGSIFCSCRLDRFEQVLTEQIQNNPEIILLEASGLSDPSSVDKILSLPAFSKIIYRGSICLADALRFESAINTALPCTRQICKSSLILLNKIDIANENDIKMVELHIKEINPKAKIVRTQHGKFNNEWFKYIVPVKTNVDKNSNLADLTLQKVQVTINNIKTIDEVKKFISEFIKSTFRVKGFINIDKDFWVIDCVGTVLNITKSEPVDILKCNRIVALAGRGMALRKDVKSAVNNNQNLLCECDWH